MIYRVHVDRKSKEFIESYEFYSCEDACAYANSLRGDDDVIFTEVLEQNEYDEEEW